jgi:hypothetical protein
MESGGKDQVTPEGEDESSPLMTGFWLGFWSLLLLIVGSWFIHVPLIGRIAPPPSNDRSGRVSLFREAPKEEPRGVPAARSIAGTRRDR